MIEQHERDLQNILNKMDADKMRMQSNLQERLKKKKEERLRNKQEELKENFKDQKRELEQKQKSEINRIKKDEVGIYSVWGSIVVGIYSDQGCDNQLMMTVDILCKV